MDFGVDVYFLSVTLKNIKGSQMENEQTKKKEQKLYINQLTESLQLSSLIFAPIFMPRKNGYKPKSDNHSITIKRTENETITYTGENLDIATDFPLFSIIISHAQMKQKNEVSLSEAELFSAIIKQRRKSTIDILEDKLEKMQKSHICIEHIDEKGVKSKIVNTSLILKSKWDRAARRIYFIIDPEFWSLELKSASKELINLQHFNIIKTGYAKALFLFLETKKFKNQKSIQFRKQDLIDRFSTNITSEKEKNRELKNALEALCDASYLLKFSFYKSSVQHIQMVEIKRTDTNKKSGFFS